MDGTEEVPQIIITFSGNDASVTLQNITPFQVMGAAELLRNEASIAYAMQRHLAMQQQQGQGLAIARTLPDLGKRQ